MLREAMLEESCQLLFDGVGARAISAPVEMRAHRALRLELQASFLKVEQVQPDVVAGHRSLTVRSP